MRLDGALKPHHGAPAIGSSSGVRKCRDKRCKPCCHTSVITLGINNYSNSNSNSNNNYSHSNSHNSDNNNNNNNNSNSIKTIGNQRSSCPSSELPVDEGQGEEEHQQQDAPRYATTRRAYCENFRESIKEASEQKQKQEEEEEEAEAKEQQHTGNHNSCSGTSKSYGINEIRSGVANTRNNTNNNNNKNNKNNNSNRRNNVINENQAIVVKCKMPAEAATVAADASVTSAMTLAPTKRPIVAAVTASAPRLAQLPAGSSIDAIATRLMRIQQSLMGRRRRPLPALVLLCFVYFATAVLLPSAVRCDDDNFFAVNSFSMGPETTTPEFDYASRGQKKFGDKCDNTLECGFPGSICDPKKKSCQCTEDLPVTNHIDKCGKEAAVNESCFFNEQCEVKYFQTECRDGRCVCRFEMSPIWDKDGTVECKGRQDKRGPEKYIDPAMIGVLVGMALMFIIICVVLRLFSQARWRENRTIFNTPNPRLMNVSLLRDSKLLHGQERRGSRMSVRAPSRQPSMASLRPHSPNPSLGKTGSRSNSGSNASAVSVRSTRSNSVAPGNVTANNSHHERKGSQYHHQQHQQQQPLITNITPNPVAESVTVEIVEPEK